MKAQRAVGCKNIGDFSSTLSFILLLVFKNIPLVMTLAAVLRGKMSLTRAGERLAGTRSIKAPSGFQTGSMEPGEKAGRRSYP